jgi:hypothetical protein
MNFYLTKKVKSTKSSKKRIWLLSLLYGFSPHFFTYYEPGHFVFLILPALFPYIQYVYEKIQISSTKDPKEFLKYLTILLLLLFGVCAPLGNVGVLATFYAFMILQIAYRLFSNIISIKQAVITFFTISVSLFITNIWWLAPYLVTMGSASELIEQSKQTIGSAIGIATSNSNILNILSGFPEGTNNSLMIESLQLLLLTIILISLYVYLKEKIRANSWLLVSILLIVFFIKGPNSPLGNLFSYLYENVPIMQIIRRPASKLYWIFIFVLFSTINSVTEKNRNKTLEIFLSIVLSLSVFNAIYLTVESVKLTPFKIPSNYYQANDYLTKDGVKKVLLLPDIGGLNPEYNREVNFHKGIDFLGQIMEFKKYIPNSTFWTIKDSERDLVEKLANQIYENETICDLSKSLNISHVVIRKDLLPTNYDQQLLDRAEKVLSKSKYVSSSKDFGNNFRIYKIIENCQSNIISSEGASFLTYVKINPTKYELQISGSEGTVMVIYREKFSKNWIMHTNSYSSLISQVFPTIGIKHQNVVFPHSQKIGYANGWDIDMKELCATNNDACKYADGKYVAKLTIEYWPQRLLYLGISVSIISFVICIGGLAYINFKEKVKK